jgi:hypothetical protein
MANGHLRDALPYAYDTLRFAQAAEGRGFRVRRRW